MQNSRLKNSYENKKIKKLYKELLIKPNSDMAHKLLHIEVDKDE
jgi:hypothetical protein